MYINAFLEPNTRSKVLTSSRYIQGSYNIVQTKEELNILSTNYKNILVNGSPCYVEEEKQLYRWRNNSWVLDESSIPTDLSELIKRINELGERVTSNETNISNLQEKVDNLEQDGGKKYFQDTLVKGDLKVYCNVGNIKADANNPVIVGKETDNNTMEDVWEKMFGQQDKDPTITNPSLNLNFTNATPKEYGTKITALNFALTKNIGSYSYGPATGVTFSNFQYSLDNNLYSILSNETTVSQDFTYGITSPITLYIKADNTEGVFAKTLIGKTSSYKISAGTVSTNKTFNPTVYKYIYYGCSNSSELPVDSNNKCIITKSTKTSVAGNYNFKPNGQFLWIVTPFKITKVVWNNNELENGSDYSLIESKEITLDTGASLEYHFYMFKGSKTGDFTYVIS